eukprot:CAMPEP_0171984674 /NCGR_PEP_ID=MMETSP0993-20121228/273951_1 /TAXON_ID=483369 /ORGANISM="non described non described, Strain CCMP2098" /LENGTH=727 /DNA_ID=CAMNT_0012637503 /DNA_START=58 /DNA_END=2238 /DNA_ORIENTATION=-
MRFPRVTVALSLLLPRLGAFTLRAVARAPRAAPLVVKRSHQEGGVAADCDAEKTGSFATLGDLLRPELLEGVSRLGYTSMTDIQANALPHALAGRDVIGQAATGSGKTAVFGLAALERLDLELSSSDLAAAAAAAAPESSGDDDDDDEAAVAAGRPQILVMCPTRELAAQLVTALRKLAVGLPGSVRVVALVGGADSRDQRASLTSGAAVHAVVGTPGRLRAHLESGALDLSQVHTLVLDEADSLLDMGFENEVNGVVDACSLPQHEEEEESAEAEQEREEEVGEGGDDGSSEPLSSSGGGSGGGGGGLPRKRRQTLLFSATWADPRVQALGERVTVNPEVISSGGGTGRSGSPSSSSSSSSSSSGGSSGGGGGGLPRKRRQTLLFSATWADPRVQALGERVTVNPEVISSGGGTGRSGSPSSSSGDKEKKKREPRNPREEVESKSEELSAGAEEFGGGGGGGGVDPSLLRQSAVLFDASLGAGRLDVLCGVLADHFLSNGGGEGQGGGEGGGAPSAAAAPLARTAQSCLVFCETRAECAEVATFLQRRGASALALHGDLEQTARDKVLACFRGGSCRVLVATSVASRGLDVANLALVVQLAPAQDPATHTHRAGRTARAGNAGRAVVLVATSYRDSASGGLADQKAEQRKVANGKAAVRRDTGGRLPPAGDFVRLNAIEKASLAAGGSVIERVKWDQKGRVAALIAGGKSGSSLKCWESAWETVLV